MNDLLDHPDAQALLQDAVVTPAAVNDCADHLTAFLHRYLPHFYRVEQRQLAHLVLAGRLSGLQRKTLEPIARQARHPRRGVQRFVGAGQWDDDAVRAELCRHVGEVLARPDGVLLLDGYAVPKKGEHSCGVGRQWCGRLGKVDNCQAGVFVGYATAAGKALLDARLYLPRDWAEHVGRRTETGVPREIGFAEKWRLGLGLLENVRHVLPHRWVVADDDYGRVSEFREMLRGTGERYVLDVPCSTRVRAVFPHRGDMTAWERADRWAARQPRKRWKRLWLRDGEKGPVEVEVLRAWVLTRDEGGSVGAREQLLVIRTREKQPQTWYVLSHPLGEEVPVWEQARAHGLRHRIEELFEEGNEEIGLDHYEVRGWVGWRHHMTLSLLALWFLQVERLRLGGENTGDHGAAGAGHLHRTAARPTREPGANCRGGQRGTAA